MPDGAPASPANGQRPAPDEVWAQVREDYLAGISAPECCRRHGVGLTALRKRAASEGWRRADQPWTPPLRLDPYDEGVLLEDRIDGDLDQVEMHELEWVADRRMMRAVLRGDAVEALRWRRVRYVIESDARELARRIHADEVMRWAFNEGPAPREAHEAHDVNGVNGVSGRGR
jgi:hypothetical protein